MQIGITLNEFSVTKHLNISYTWVINILSIFYGGT